MEKLDLSKLKLASSSLGERIKTSGAQMGRTITSKMKEILQTPTPESKIVDEATGESMAAGPNWGLNLRICAMISRSEYDGAEIVRAIKRKLVPGKNPVEQGLSLDLLEACASNCDKVSSAVASEKVLEDMVNLIEDSRTEHGIRMRAMQLIRDWGESEELEYLPVFQQTYMQLKLKEIPRAALEEDYPPALYNLESYLGQQQQQPAPERYPVPNTGVENEQDATLIGKCKQSLPVVQRIIESTSDDEVMLFDALNLHDELQLIISKHGDLVAAIKSERPKNDDNSMPLDNLITAKND
ncbi:target of myb protein 1 [Phtheirospermum japonicum]|uniref:Target of myb protein 1 n=1 Tax=Phtheirospermum japonicum TaxID=374723 RepID=A0A830BA84_9LAMI|nr:target of myb protein 1 [Phtheirospermum japonicum]